MKMRAGLVTLVLVWSAAYAQLQCDNNAAEMVAQGQWTDAAVNGGDPTNTVARLKCIQAFIRAEYRRGTADSPSRLGLDFWGLPPTVTPPEDDTTGGDNDLFRSEVDGIVLARFSLDMRVVNPDGTVLVECTDIQDLGFEGATADNPNNLGHGGCRTELPLSGPQVACGATIEADIKFSDGTVVSGVWASLGFETVGDAPPVSAVDPVPGAVVAAPPADCSAVRSTAPVRVVPPPPTPCVSDFVGTQCPECTVCSQLPTVVTCSAGDRVRYEPAFTAAPNPVSNLVASAIGHGVTPGFLYRRDGNEVRFSAGPADFKPPTIVNGNLVPTGFNGVNFYQDCVQDGEGGFECTLSHIWTHRLTLANGDVVECSTEDNNELVFDPVSEENPAGLGHGSACEGRRRGNRRRGDPVPDITCGTQYQLFVQAAPNAPRQLVYTASRFRDLEAVEAEPAQGPCADGGENDVYTIATQECDYSVADSDPITQAFVQAWQDHGAFFEAAYSHGGADSIRRLRPEPAGIIPPWFPYDPANTKAAIYNACTNSFAPDGAGGAEFFTRCPFRNPYTGEDGDFLMLVHTPDIISPTEANSKHSCTTDAALLDYVSRDFAACELPECRGHGGCDIRWDGTEQQRVRCGDVLTVLSPRDSTGRRRTICKATF